MKGRYWLLFIVFGIIFLVDFTRYNVKHYNPENHIQSGEYTCNGKDDPCEKGWLTFYNCSPHCKYAVHYMVETSRSPLGCSLGTGKDHSGFDLRKVWYPNILPFLFIIMGIIGFFIWYNSDNTFLEKLDNTFKL